jgi:hypothetical protein
MRLKKTFPLAGGQPHPHGLQRRPRPPPQGRVRLHDRRLRSPPSRVCTRRGRHANQGLRNSWTVLINIIL